MAIELAKSPKLAKKVVQELQKQPNGSYIAVAPQESPSPRTVRATLAKSGQSVSSKFSPVIPFYNSLESRSPMEVPHRCVPYQRTTRRVAAVYQPGLVECPQDWPEEQRVEEEEEEEEVQRPMGLWAREGGQQRVGGLQQEHAGLSLEAEEEATRGDPAEEGQLLSTRRLDLGTVQLQTDLTSIGCKSCGPQR